MNASKRPRVVPKGLYLVCWPNGSFSVLYFKTKVRIEDLFFEIDAFGNPLDARIVHFNGEVGIDFNVTKRRGRYVISKELTDRSRVRRIVFPDDVQRFVYASMEATDGPQA